MTQDCFLSFFMRFPEVEVLVVVHKEVEEGLQVVVAHPADGKIKKFK
jgi:hypothetical protein